MPNAKWNNTDDAKLNKLLKLGKRRGIDSTDLNKEAIEAVIKKHWPHRTYKSSAQLFRKKYRTFNLNATLNGSRKPQYKDSKFTFVASSIQF